MTNPVKLAAVVLLMATILLPTTLYAAASYHTPTTATGTSWSLVANTKDDNLGTYSTYYHSTTGWSTYLEFTHDSMMLIGVRVYTGSGASSYDVDAYYNSQWNHIYDGAMTAGAWANVACSIVYPATTFRLRCYNTIARNSIIGEVDFNYQEMGQVDLLPSTPTLYISDYGLFNATVKDSSNDTIPYCYIDWNATAGLTLTHNHTGDANGLGFIYLTCNTTGNYTLTASVGGKNDTATVTYTQCSQASASPETFPWWFTAILLALFLLTSYTHSLFLCIAGIIASIIGIAWASQWGLSTQIELMLQVIYLIAAGAFLVNIFKGDTHVFD